MCAEPIERFPLDMGPFDAALSESVLFNTDLPRALNVLRRVLRPGGRLGLVEMVWTERADPGGAARLHDETLRQFGIPMASRTRWTWSDWRHMLMEADFSVYEEACLGAGSPQGTMQAGQRRRTAARAMVREPWLAVDLLRHRWRMARHRVPPGWVESWMAIAIRGARPPSG